MNQIFANIQDNKIELPKWLNILLAILSIGVVFLPIYTNKAEYLFIPLAIVGTTLFFFYRKFLFAILCLTLPFSHEIAIPGLQFNLSIPGELLIAILSIWAAYTLIYNSKETSYLIKHPVTWLIILFWISAAISTLNSTMTQVSVKAFILLTCYLLVFYFLVHKLLIRNNFTALQPYILYSSLLVGFAIYATIRHSGYSFDKNVAGFVVKPFFSDHTIYGACLAFLLPITVGMFFYSKKLNFSYPVKLFWLFSSIVFLVAVFFSHSRASWMSIMAAMLFYFILKFKIQFKTLVIWFVSILLVGGIFIDVLAPAFFKNKNDSKAKGANLEEQLKSVTNMKKDVSNAERVNRWMCAFRMLKEKPLTGYGAGTYQYQYLPFQKSSEMTIISVTSAKVKHLQGFGGTAHSEYLLAFSEMGILGGLSIFLMIFIVIRTGMNTYYDAKNEIIKYSSMFITLAMVTYFVHGFFNNFLTTDKAGFLFWSGCAILVALEIKNKISQSSPNS